MRTGSCTGTTAGWGAESYSGSGRRSAIGGMEAGPVQHLDIPGVPDTVGPMSFGPEWFVILGIIAIPVFIWILVRAFRQGRRG
jgi:hypothetical protein